MSTTPVNQTLSGYWQQIPADTAAAVRPPRRQTKIVCTLGPSSTAPDMILALARAGMDVARLNFSHGTHEDHAARIEAVRDAAAEVGRPIAVLADLCGPKIRVRGLDAPLVVAAGDQLVLSGAAAPAAAGFAISFSGLAECVSPGDPILIDDGLVRLRTERVDGTDVHCVVEVEGGSCPTRESTCPAPCCRSRR